MPPEFRLFKVVNCKQRQCSYTQTDSFGFTNFGTAFIPNHVIFINWRQLGWLNVYWKQLGGVPGDILSYLRIYPNTILGLCNNYCRAWDRSYLGLLQHLTARNVHFSPNLGSLGTGYSVEHDLELLILFLAPFPNHLHDKAWTTLPNYHVFSSYFLLFKMSVKTCFCPHAMQNPSGKARPALSSGSGRNSLSNWPVFLLEDCPTPPWISRLSGVYFLTFSSLKSTTPLTQNADSSSLVSLTILILLFGYVKRPH